MNIWEKIRRFFGWRPDSEIPAPIPIRPAPPLPPPPAAPPAPEDFYDSQSRLLINREGMALVKHFEALYLEAYRDPVGVVTIGWGTIIYPNGRKVRMGDKCTEAEATEWLMHDLWGDGAKYVRAYTNDAVENSLNGNQFSALVSLTYNRGAGRFKNFVAPHLNNQDLTSALTAMVGLNWSGKESERIYLLGLDRRRWAERYLFEGKDWRAFESVDTFKAFKNRGYR